MASNMTTPESEAVSREAMERRRQYLLRWFQPDSGEETVNFADRDGNWTILTFLDDLARASSQAAGVEALLDVEPQVVEPASGPEPSLRAMVRFYYAQHAFDRSLIDRQVSEYFAALATPAASTTTAEARADGEVTDADRRLRIALEDHTYIAGQGALIRDSGLSVIAAHRLATQPAPVSGADAGLREKAEPLLRAYNYAKELNELKPKEDGSKYSIKDFVLSSELEAIAAALKAPAPSREGVGEEAIERVARVIDPYAFSQWPKMVEHSIASGDSPDDARLYADSTYGGQQEKARETARVVLAALQPTASTDTDDVRPTVEGEGDRG